MATKKKTNTGAAAKTAGRTSQGATIDEAYQKALVDYTAALESLRSGDYEQARKAFNEIATIPDEPVLVDRARTYVALCERKLAAEPVRPNDPEGLYYHGVIEANNGNLDEAVQCFDQALSSNPTSARFLYARASAYALKRNAGAAVADLRQAIVADPQIRFQAVNDSDFEQIREEPAFIDIIEPTPTGA